MPRFDPYTGAPLGPDGAPLQPRFDPYTGAPLTPGATGVDGDRAEASRPIPPPPPFHQGAGPAVRVSAGGRSVLRSRAVVASAGAVVLVALAVGIWVVTGPLADARARDRAERAQAAAQAAETTRTATCEGELQEAYDALSELDSRLDVGVNQQDFGGFVGDAQVLFDQIDTDVVDANSCAAYEEMEAAIGIYIATNSAWNDCIFDDYCDPDTDLSLGSDWVTASEHLERAADGGLGRAGGEPA